MEDLPSWKWYMNSQYLCYYCYCLYLKKSLKINMKSLTDHKIVRSQKHAWKYITDVKQLDIRTTWQGRNSYQKQNLIIKRHPRWCSCRCFQLWWCWCYDKYWQNISQKQVIQLYNRRYAMRYKINRTEAKHVSGTELMNQTHLTSACFWWRWLCNGECVTIYSTTKFLTQIKNKISIEVSRARTVLKHKYYKIMMNKQEYFYTRY